MGLYTDLGIVKVTIIIIIIIIIITYRRLPILLVPFDHQSLQLCGMHLERNVCYIGYIYISGRGDKKFVHSC